MPKSQPQILPTSVKPLKYTLTLKPNLSNFTFEGQEFIDIEILTPTSIITLNCIEIEIKKCDLILTNDEIVCPDTTSFDEHQETVSFKFSTPLPVGKSQLLIEFTGELNDKLRGFYRSQYEDSDGNQRYLASTQFEPTDARRAFPCWDEPAVKAIFDITLVIPKDSVAISNMPIETKTETNYGLNAFHFAITPLMSTYLLVFVVGDLDFIEQQTNNGTLIRVWATRGKEHQGQYALDASMNLLDYMNNYFGIPYPLPKLDHIAIPDFAAGAMENWGAITYRETALLVDDKNSSAGTRQIVSAIIAHEMAHMWFGDLVTMTWWNDLWLNESFASWMGDKAVDHLHPEWAMWTQFLTADTNRALNLDGLKNSHPIEQIVNDPGEIGQLFDAISYSKGASIIRMLEDFLGPEIFQKGLHHYLTTHQYKNAQTKDLWESFEHISGQPVTTIMNTWTKQTGYPVLDAKIHSKENLIEVNLTQSKFIYENILGKTDTKEILWHIPITIRSASNANPVSILMDNQKITTNVEPAPYGSSDEWVKLNPLQTGFYRVKYSPTELSKLIYPIQNLVLPASDRLGIQNDTYALAKSNDIPISEFLNITKAYVNENDASVCADLASHLNNLDGLLWDEPYYATFKTFARNIFKPIGARTGWEPQLKEEHLQVLLRSTVLSQLGRYDDIQTIEEANKRFDQYVTNSTNINPDIRSLVFNLAAKHGGQSTYNTMWALQKQTNLQEEKERLLVALANFKQPDLLSDILEKSLSNEVRTHDAITVLTSVSGNRHGRELAWEFLKSNWNEFKRRYGDGGFGLMRIVSISSGFSTSEKLHDVEQFFLSQPTPAAERTIQQSIERIKLNVAWINLNRSILQEWFTQYES
jgi:puromycin-sensitive aminopeptidase